MKITQTVSKTLNKKNYRTGILKTAKFNKNNKVGYLMYICFEAFHAKVELSWILLLDDVHVHSFFYENTLYKNIETQIV